MVGMPRALALWALLVCGTCSMAASAATLAVPQTHPRLWYSVQSGSPGLARLQRARAFSLQNAVPIPGWSPSDRFRQLALRSLIRGQGDPSTDQDCHQALEWLAGFTLNVGGTSSDEARWDGENAILVYDWCHYALADAMTAQEREDLIERWNGYIATLNSKSWGGLTMPANNYFWGYLRNSLLWGIASYHDGGTQQRQIAQGFIDHALDVRYRDLNNPAATNRNKFHTWYEAFGIGGVPLEGLQYGPYMLDYPVIGFTTAADYGYDAWAAVPFWRDAVYYLQYAATPSATRARDGAPLHHELFPFNDDEFFVNGGSAEQTGYANFLGAMILRDPLKPLARQAKRWMDARAAQPSWWIRAELATTSVTPNAPTTPLDYYADGSQFFYGRSAATADATTFMQQLGGANAYTSSVQELEPDGGVGHSHQDLGNFQLWRKGRWITRETTGYDIDDDGVRGWNNGPVVNPLEAVAHNTVLFQGRGQIYTRRGWSRVLRLQSTPDFAYSAVDMVDSYRAPADESWLAEDDWPFAEVAIREFIYLRTLEAMVILDRVKSGNDSLDPIYDISYDGPQMAGTQVKKSFVLHATGTGSNENGNPYSLNAAAATAVIGDQRMDLRTLLPANPAYRVIDEGGNVGQFRLEYDVSGTELSYLLNIVSARDAAQAQITATLQDLGNVWQVMLTHPQKGTATLTLRKGETSTGGSVRIGQGAAIALREDRQAMLISDGGVAWDGIGCRIIQVGGRYPICYPDAPMGPIPGRPGRPVLPLGHPRNPLHDTQRIP